MRVGRTVKHLRKSKKIRATSIYRNLLSRPAINKFENGESDTTTEKFMLILERMNITLEEFEIAHSIINKKDDNEIYSPGAYKKAFYNKDIQQLQYLSAQSLQKFEETQVVKYRHNSAIINLLIHDIDSSIGNIKPEVVLLQKYLSECEYWSYYEITLFTNTMNYYSFDFIEVTYKHAKRTLMSYQGLVRYKNELAIMLFNILHLKISAKCYTKLNYYFEELTLLQDECLDKMYIQTIIRFYSLLIQIINNPGLQNSLEPELHKIINFFEYLEMNYKAEQCRKLVSLIT